MDHPGCRGHALRAGRSSVPGAGLAVLAYYLGRTVAARHLLARVASEDVVIVILLRALDYPASAGHASGRESAGAEFAARQCAARRLARAGPGRRGRFPEMKGHVAQDAASEPDPGAVDEAASREEFAAQASR
jgi:hypothetical protein